MEEILFWNLTIEDEKSFSAVVKSSQVTSRTSQFPSCHQMISKVWHFVQCVSLIWTSLTWSNLVTMFRFRLEPIFYANTAALKIDHLHKNDKKWLKNKHLSTLIYIRYTHCRTKFSRAEMFPKEWTKLIFIRKFKFFLTMKIFKTFKPNFGHLLDFILCYTAFWKLLRWLLNFI